MNYFNHSICSGEVYFHHGETTKDGACPSSKGVWSNRPAVVISSPADIAASDSVFVVYLSKGALRSPWYQKISRAKAYVQLCGELRAALCASVVLVNKDELFEENYMDQLTEDDLLKITDAVRNCCRSDECFLNCLYSSKDRDNEPQMG